MELQRVMDEVLVHNKVEKCVRPLTAAAYASDLRCRPRHWEKVGLPDAIEGVTIWAVRHCLASMHIERPYKSSRPNRRIDTFRSVFCFAVEQMRSPKAEKKLPVYHHRRSS